MSDMDVLRRLKKHDTILDRLNTREQGGVTGTFSPTFTGSGGAGSITYDTQFGHYTLINDLCFCRIHINTAVVTSVPTGNLQIGGLPFTSANVTEAGPAACADYSNINLTAGYTQLGVRVDASATTALFIQSGDNVTAAAVAGSAMTGNNVEVVLTIVYEVA